MFYYNQLFSFIDFWYSFILEAILVDVTTLMVKNRLMFHKIVSTFINIFDEWLEELIYNAVYMFNNIVCKIGQSIN